MAWSSRRECRFNIWVRRSHADAFVAASCRSGSSSGSRIQRSLYVIGLVAAALSFALIRATSPQPELNPDEVAEIFALPLANFLTSVSPYPPPPPAPAVDPSVGGKAARPPKPYYSYFDANFADRRYRRHQCVSRIALNVAKVADRLTLWLSSQVPDEQRGVGHSARARAHGVRLDYLIDTQGQIFS